jgi:hypothetical protein
MPNAAAETQLDELWDEKRLSRVIHLSLDVIRRNRRKGVGISFIKLGKSVRYDPGDVRAYLERCKRRTASAEESQK